MNQNDNKKPQGGKNGSNMRGVFTLVAWALILTVLFSSAGTYMNQSMDASTQVEVDYSEFLDMVEEDHISRVEYDSETGLLLITPEKDYVYTDSEGTEHKAGSVEFYTRRWAGDENLTELLRTHDVEFTQPHKAQMPVALSILLSYVVPFVFILLMFSLLSRIMAKRGGGIGGIGGVGKANAKVYMEKSTGVTFRDVAGQDEAKESLTEIIDFLHNPGKYTEIGAKLPKGALLVGPPGTGKTLLAKAVAGEANVPFFSISGSEFVEMFVGRGAAKVRDLFKQANEKAPCIVFIDEIDTIGKKRDGNFGGNDEREQTLNQLLTEMDGFDGSKGVVVLAATNRPDSLDPALLRPGRFDRRIPVELPDLKGRVEILKVHARKIKLEPGVDFEPVAKTAAGASGAELANIVNEAALRAVRCGRKAASQEDLMESVETVIAGYEKKSRMLSDREKKIVAYHEIGHALVAARQNNSAPVQKITIIPRTSGALGYTLQVDEGDHFLMNKDELLNKIATYAGGRAAEELVFDSVTTGASNDIEQATKLARAMVTQFGMTDEFGMVAFETMSNQYLGGDASLTCSPETQARLDRKVMEIVESQRQKARRILTENMDKLHELAAYLYSHETITGEEFMAILNK